MNLKDVHSVYFLGIGGIGMSALARYFNALGIKVAGYDKTPTPLTAQLINEGIAIHFEEDVQQIPDAVDFVVLTPAVPKEHKELEYFNASGAQVLKRSQVLGLISENTFTIGVAGTHGKTSITSIITHLFYHSNKNIAAFVGGITQNYTSNLVLSEKPEITIVEADEFDRSFLTLHPDIAVISSMDADHLDVYHEKTALHKSFNQYVHQLKDKGTLFIKEGLESSITTHHNVHTYAISQTAACGVVNIRKDQDGFLFDFEGELCIKDIRFSSSAYYNVENAAAAISVAVACGITAEEIKSALATYKGVKRRFEYIVQRPECTYIDDYAHHPSEIDACVNSVKKLFPDKKITAIFQPHLYSRTRDFADDFARSLEKLDEIILLDIYPAREKPIEGVDAQMLFDKIQQVNKKLASLDNVLEFLEGAKPEVLLTIGAGNIDTLVEPIKKLLSV